MEDGMVRSLTVQLRDVDKSLLSVSKMVKGGDRVVFDDSGIYIEDKVTRGKIWMIEVQGMYTVNMWMKEGGGRGPVFNRQGYWTACLQPIRRLVSKAERVDL